MNLSEIRQAIGERDWWRCVRCGELITDRAGSVHHRQLGDRSNNAAPNLILLDGTGVPIRMTSVRRMSVFAHVPPPADDQCHPWAHAHNREARDEGGYIVSRHTPASLIAAQPVFYNQPGRVGWFLLNDDFTLTPWEPV